MAAAEPDGPLQFSDQVFPVVLGELETTGVVELCGFVDVVVDLGEAATVGIAGLVVEGREPGPGSVGERVGRLAGDGAGRERAPLDGDEVEYVELPARVGEQPCRGSGSRSGHASGRCGPRSGRFSCRRHS